MVSEEAPESQVPVSRETRPIRVATNKNAYFTGEDVEITVQYARPVDRCMYHVVKCEIFDSGGRRSGSQEWDDRYVSFPQTWSFKLFQPDAYNVIASVWHNGQTRKEEHGARITLLRSGSVLPAH